MSARASPKQLKSRTTRKQFGQAAPGDRTNFNSKLKELEQSINDGHNLTAEAKRVANSIVFEVVAKLTNAARIFSKTGNKKTILPAHVEGAVETTFGQLAGPAVISGKGAANSVSSWNANNLVKVATGKMSASGRAGMSSRRKNPDAKRQSLSSKAGLILPAARVKNIIKTNAGGLRVSTMAVVATTAYVQYLIQVLFESAGNIASAAKVKRLTPGHLHAAVANNSSLQSIIGATAVVLPQVNPKAKRAPRAKRAPVARVSPARVSPARTASNGLTSAQRASLARRMSQSGSQAGRMSGGRTGSGLAPLPGLPSFGGAPMF